jgi:hypothetical protein
MNWREKLTDKLSNLLRFCIQGALIIDGLIIALASVYVVLKLAWFTTRYLDRIWFSAPW